MLAQSIADPLVRLRFLRATAEPAHRLRPLLVTGGVAALALGMWSHASKSAAGPPGSPPPRSEPPKASEPAGVWLVQSRSGQELYSNGLRVEAEGAA